MKGILIRRYFWCFVTLSKLITWLFGNPSTADKRSTGRPLLSPSQYTINPSPLAYLLCTHLPYRNHLFLFYFDDVRHTNTVRTKTCTCRLSLFVSLCLCHCLFSRIKLFFIEILYRCIHIRFVCYY